MGIHDCAWANSTHTNSFWWLWAFWKPQKHGSKKTQGATPVSCISNQASAAAVAKLLVSPNTADEAYHGSKPTWWEQFGCRAEHGHEVLLLTLPVRCSLWGAAHHHLLGPTAADTASTSPHRKKCFCFEVFRKLGFDFRRLPAVNTFHWFFTGLCHLTFLWICKHFFTSFTLAQQHCFNSSFPIRFFGYPLVLRFIKLPWSKMFWSFCSASFHSFHYCVGSWLVEKQPFRKRARS